MKQAQLKPTNTIGFAYFMLAITLTAFAAILSAQPFGIVWLAGQLLFAIAFLEWFVVLHEAGHHTLYRHRLANIMTGYLAGLFALIPFGAWCHIHARHHAWTGWQDMDATTATLVPRRLSAWEKVAINFAWKTWLPLFSILYRLQNYWHPIRLRQFLSASVMVRIRVEMLAMLLAYTALICWAGLGQLLSHCGLGLFLALMIQDPLLLSQHTHIHSNLAKGKTVRPFPPREQEIYTRSIRLPAWFSLLIMHFDAHELHHIFVQAPGYHLRRINYQPKNEVHWWTWLRESKRLSGVEFLFGRRDETGFEY
jgi:acyl-lipid omega-6 desaturase (Delta-12 desaturase)